MQAFSLSDDELAPVYINISSASTYLAVNFSRPANKSLYFSYNRVLHSLFYVPHTVNLLFSYNMIFSVYSDLFNNYSKTNPKCIYLQQ